MRPGRHKRKRLQEAERARTLPSGRTRLLGVLAGSAVATMFAAEVLRVWRLGTLPRGREDAEATARSPARVTQTLAVLREGYSVSRTREDPLFNMLAAFTVTFATTRGITWHIREQGGLGPLRDVVVGDRHIHHFVPGGLIALGAGGAAISIKNAGWDRWLAFPFGIGVALVLDESALLLELDDVYWTEEGVLSVQIAFAAMTVLAALTYLIRIVRHQEVHSAEDDWRTAARAWDDLQLVPGGVEGFGIGG